VTVIMVAVRALPEAPKMHMITYARTPWSPCPTRRRLLRHRPYGHSRHGDPPIRTILPVHIF
jgi:hypothetical protein